MNVSFDIFISAWRWIYLPENRLDLPDRESRPASLRQPIHCATARLSIKAVLNTRQRFVITVHLIAPFFVLF
jgi:predicted N-formylglutamate amidohydrolase